MTCSEYVQQALRLYLQAPDTPPKPRRSDPQIATELYQRAVPIQVLQHAIQLATLRRNLRPQDREPLEPIRSMAYFRPLIQHVLSVPPDPGYVDYVDSRYRLLIS